MPRIAPKCDGKFIFYKNLIVLSYNLQLKHSLVSFLKIQHLKNKKPLLNI